MYAIIEDSGGQIKVQQGDDVLIDLRDVSGSDELTFDRVLVIGGAETDAAQIGAPYVDGAKVTAEVTDARVLGDKIDVIKFKRRKGYRRKQGHRQAYTAVRIKAIHA